MICCPWCLHQNSNFEPFDSDDADASLCRTHVAEYEGLSLNGLDRADDEMARDLL